MLQRTLKPGEKVIVDTSSLVAWEATVTIDVKTVGDVCMCCFGGSGIFNTELSGARTLTRTHIRTRVWLSSLILHPTPSTLTPEPGPLNP